MLPPNRSGRRRARRRPADSALRCAEAGRPRVGLGGEAGLRVGPVVELAGGDVVDPLAPVVDVALDRVTCRTTPSLRRGAAVPLARRRCRGGRRWWGGGWAGSGRRCRRRGRGRASGGGRRERGRRRWHGRRAGGRRRRRCRWGGAGGRCWRRRCGGRGGWGRGGRPGGGLADGRWVGDAARWGRGRGAAGAEEEAAEEAGDGERQWAAGRCVPSARGAPSRAVGAGQGHGVCRFPRGLAVTGSARSARPVRRGRAAPAAPAP